MWKGLSEPHKKLMLDTSREAQTKCRELTESVDNFAAAKTELEPQGHDGGARPTSRPSARWRRRRSGRPTRQQYAGLWDADRGVQGIGARVALDAEDSSATFAKFVVAFLLVAAIVNLLVGVFLRYVMLEVTDWLDVDPIRFTWVEEVGEMMLAWLTLIGAAIGVRERTALHPARAAPVAGNAQVWAERIHHVLIAGFGALAAWYGVKLCLLNRTLATPGLEINLAVLYASAVVGGILLAIYAVLDDRGAAAARSQHRTTGSKGRMILLAAAAIIVVADPVLHADRLRARRLPAWPACGSAAIDMQRAVLEHWCRARRAGCCSPSRPSSSPAA